MEQDILQKIELFRRVYANAAELLKESKYLYDGGFYKRSLFLALCSFEEIRKIEMVFLGEKGVFRHDEKFKTLKDRVALVVKPKFYEQVRPQVESQAKEKSFDSETAERFIEQFVKMGVEAIEEVFDFKKVRESLIYEDLNKDSIHRQLVNDSGVKSYAEIFIRNMDEKIEILKSLGEERVADPV